MVAIIILPTFTIRKQANNLGLTCPGSLVSNRIISLNMIVASSFPQHGYIHGKCSWSTGVQGIPMGRADSLTSNYKCMKHVQKPDFDVRRSQGNASEPLLFTMVAAVYPWRDGKVFLQYAPS